MPETEKQATYDHKDEEQVDEWSRILNRKPHQPTIAFVGPTVEHDMPCPVHPHLFAVYQCNTGVFHPSWGAQQEGWRLVRARNWLQRLILHIFFSEDPVRDDHIVRP